MDCICDKFVMVEDGEVFDMSQAAKGDPGPGVAPGGTTGQLLAKASDTDYDTEWIDAPDMDAGGVTYDPTEAYDDGTVGKELTTINSALTSLQSVTEIIDTASGAIASFPDGGGLPMRSLIAQINPVQDLHGYANPWPAGGGKNLLPYPYSSSSGVYSGVTFTKNDDGTVNISGTSTGTIFFNLRSSSQGQRFTLKAGSYVINGAIANTVIVVGRAADNIAIGFSNNNNGEFTIESDTEVFAFIQITSGYTLNGTAKPMIRLSSVTDATFAPYENLCPISGHTGLSVEVTGANVWDEETQPGYYDATTGNYAPSATNQLCSKNFTPVKPNTQYVFQKANNLGDILFYNSSKELIGSVVNRQPNSVFTTPENCSFIKINLGSAYGNVYNHNVGINYPSTDTTYHAYTGTTTTVTFPDSAGTVYGGSDEVVGGELTSTMGEVDLGTLTWYYNTSQKVFFSAPIEGIKKYNSNAAIPNWICSSFPVYSLNIIREDGGSKSIGLGQGYQSAIDLSNCQCVRDDRFTDPNAFKNAMSGVKLVYELATPQTYQLTPQQVSTLLGQNNVWHDANGDTTVTYQASIKGYIDKVLGS